MTGTVGTEPGTQQPGRRLRPPVTRRVEAAPGNHQPGHRLRPPAPATGNPARRPKRAQPAREPAPPKAAGNHHGQGRLGHKTEPSHPKTLSHRGPPGPLSTYG